ncbi:hypothetical protein ASA1KI_11820 [Opitutales bacterium ASA1]|uniref:S1C family serine protease n=1 Tax=Congregicoccus parvus TaxID=3081749 RepID=UPI002B30E5ED|nr:hypothetical protein ASA1KI_11820 [Opitutales bacterium ASA1]
MHILRNVLSLLLLGAALRAETAAATDSTVPPFGRTERVERRIDVSSMSTTDGPKKTVTFLGLSTTDTPAALSAQLGLPEGRGLVVAFVEPGSPAEKAGLQQHDVLLRLDDQILVGARQLSVLVRGYADGDTVTLTYLRRGAEARATAVLTTREMPVDRMIHLDTGFGTTGFQWSMPDVPTDPGALREFRFKFPEPAVAPAAPMPRSASRVMIFRPKSNIVYSDDEGTLRLTSDEEARSLRVVDASGKLLFEGPVRTEEERAALPAEIRARLEKLENMEVEVPPAPPAVPVAPAPPGSPGRSVDVEVNVDASAPITAASDAARAAERVARRWPWVL